MPRFSANLGHLFVEYPLIERIGAAAKAGFKAIELQNPYELAPSAVKAEIDRHGLTMLNLNTPPGRDGEPGLAAVPGREEEFWITFSKALDYIVAIGGNSLHVLSGIVPPHQRPAAETVLVANLKRAARRGGGEKHLPDAGAAQPARPAGLFRLAHRAHRRRDRQGRQAQPEDHVRLLPRAGDAG